MQTTKIETSNVNELIKQTASLVSQGWTLRGEVKNSLDWMEGEAVVVLAQEFQLDAAQQTFFALDSTPVVTATAATDNPTE